MPKSTKRFTLSTSQLNGHGFRLLTEGADLDGFRANPVMLFNHQRPNRESKDVILPLGHWEDIEVNGDNITAVPFFDDKDEFAMAIYHKVEAGHLRMCSIGADPVEISDAPEHLLPGQTLSTATKWTAVEASIVDIGANPGSLASDIALYRNGAQIQLSNQPISNIIPQIKMAKEEKPAGEETAQKEVELKLSKATETIATLTKEKGDLATEIESLKTEATTNKAKSLVELAFGQKKITETQKAKYEKLAMADYDSTKEVLDEMPAHVSLRDRLKGDGSGADADKLVKLSAKSFNDLWKQNNGKDLQWLKENAPDVYEEKRKEGSASR